MLQEPTAGITQPVLEGLDIRGTDRASQPTASSALRLTFLGTRGGIEIASRRHRRHSALLVEHLRSRIVIDCGDDWRGKLAAFQPEAILVTHAHPDHAGGLVDGAPCPVYASSTTCRALSAFPIDLRALAPGAPTQIGGLAIEMFPVVHSLLAPAVGYRIARRVFYVPDIVDLRLRARRAVLGPVELYVGDGARVIRPLIRRSPTGRRFGHTSIRTQLAWCTRFGVTRAIFTHCGSEIVRDHASATKTVREIGRECGVDAQIAYDGLVVNL